MATKGLKIVCYTGGTCGDLITAMIDPSNSVLNTDLKTVQLTQDRSRLKKKHLFANDLDKVQYLDDISLMYSSIPSHDTEFHKHRHDFLTITVEDFNVALWAAERFQNCHRPHVWEEMSRACGAHTVEHYAQTMIDYSNMIVNFTNKSIKLESIISGHAVEQLETMLQHPISAQGRSFYHDWLIMQNNLPR